MGPRLVIVRGVLVIVRVVLEPTVFLLDRVDTPLHKNSFY